MSNKNGKVIHTFTNEEHDLYPHRYLVEQNTGWNWVPFESYRWKWIALANAESLTRLGYDFRVIDTRYKED